MGTDRSDAAAVALEELNRLALEANHRFGQGEFIAASSSLAAIGAVLSPLLDDLVSRWTACDEDEASDVPGFYL